MDENNFLKQEAWKLKFYGKHINEMCYDEILVTIGYILTHNPFECMYTKEDKK